MSGLLYYLLTFAESVTSIFGIRAPYEQPGYAVIQDLGQNIEVRQYEPRLAIEAVIVTPDREKGASEAFGLLFRYITGANQTQQKIAMTTPVRTEDSSQRIAMTVPVQTTGSGGQVSMRFFLPRDVAQAGAPEPTDKRLHLVNVPASTIAALRFSGVSTGPDRDHYSAILLGVLAKSAWRTTGDVFQLNYDPPFTIPFLRRNEVAVPVEKSS